MIPVDLALALRAAGLTWRPVQGDAFAVPDRDLDGEVFWLSDMVISRLDVPDGPPVLAFNGTTEWALDSLEVAEAVWLPREDQLRGLLGDAFAALRRVEGGYVVDLVGGSGPGGGAWHADTTPAAAYARALLAVLDGLDGLDGLSDRPGAG